MNLELIQIGVVGAICLLAGSMLARRVLAKAGIGRHDGKPDCGCGHCADKRK